MSQRQNVFGLTQDNVKNTSYLSVPYFSYDGLPEANGGSMKMITTVLHLEKTTDDNLAGEVDLLNEEQQDSLAQRMSDKQTITQSAKKKRVGCSCKKTLCLKMYCECFASNRHCCEDCACCGCRNIEQHQEEITIARAGVKDGGLRNCNLSDKRCNCKKSQCQKKYCQCYNSDVGCTDACKCIDCLNKEDRPIPQQDEEYNQEAPAARKKAKVQISLQKSVTEFDVYYVS